MSNMDKFNAIGNEINGYKTDKVIGERELNSLKNKMAEALLNGLGDDIKETLTTPIVDKRSKIRKIIDKLIKVCN